MRNIIIHYHLFKNAGTSVDKILSSSFRDTWLNWDKVGVNSKIHSSELAEFILDQPQLSAISSHHVVPPIPIIEGVRVFPLVFIRHPIVRARSAYLFEWQKEKGVDVPIGSFKEYVEEKIEGKKFSVISNFHVNRLGHTMYSDKVYDTKELRGYEVLQRAKLFLDNLPYFGLVENFYQSLVRMHFYLKSDFKDIRVQQFEANVTQSTAYKLDDKVDAIAKELGDDIYEKLVQANELDLAFYKYAVNRFYSVAK